MNNLDSQLIFEAYREEVLDEGLKDVAKKAVQYGAIGAAAAGSAFGSPPAKSAPAAEPPAITQTVQSQGDKVNNMFQQFSKENNAVIQKTLDELKQIRLEMEKSKAEFQKLSKEMGDPYAQLMALELQHKMEKAKSDYQMKQHEIESNRVYKMAKEKKISYEQMDKMLDDLDKKYGLDFDIEEVKKLFAK
jgi:Skp family chaperone for outer membrane proteins